VVFDQGQALHLLVAEARLQSLDEPREPFALALRAREQLAARRLAVDDVMAGQAQLQRGRGQLHAREAFAQQHLQVRGVARRLGQRNFQRGGRGRLGIASVPRLVLHVQTKACDLRVLRGRPGGQPRQQTRGAVQHLLGRVGACEEFQPAVEVPGQRDP
jgi:hypothetical protein